MTIASDNVTLLLRKWSEGDSSALEQLMALVYDELHRLAHQHMRRESAGHILQTSALINETYFAPGRSAANTAGQPRALFWYRSAVDATYSGR